MINNRLFCRSFSFMYRTNDDIERFGHGSSQKRCSASLRSHVFSVCWLWNCQITVLIALLLVYIAAVLLQLPASVSVFVSVRVWNMTWFLFLFLGNAFLFKKTPRLCVTQPFAMIERPSTTTVIWFNAQAVHIPREFLHCIRGILPALYKSVNWNFWYLCCSE